FFFFQAEDGIRDRTVTGVQTCALPIFGFPAEDDAAFERTLRTVEAAGLTKVHVFPYSPRPGTATAADDRVPPATKKERGSRLREIGRASCRERVYISGWGAR